MVKAHDRSRLTNHIIARMNIKTKRLVESRSRRAFHHCDMAIRLLTKLRDDIGGSQPEYAIAGNALEDLYRAKSHLTINITRTKQ